MNANPLSMLSKEIVDALQSVCNDLKLDRTIPCTIKTVYSADTASNYTYDVMINNSTYKLYSSISEIYDTGDTVWVTYPCGDFNNAFISGRRKIKYGNTCYK